MDLYGSGLGMMVDKQAPGFPGNGYDKARSRENQYNAFYIVVMMAVVTLPTSIHPFVMVCPLSRTRGEYGWQYVVLLYRLPLYSVNPQMLRFLA